MAFAPAAGFGTLFDPTALLHAVGPFAIPALILIVFIETGLLFPFPLRSHLGGCHRRRGGSQVGYIMPSRHSGPAV